MQTATTFALILLRVTGLIQLVLGVLFWSGNAQALIPVHMRIGFVLVLTLWTLAMLAARVGIAPGVVVLAVAWGALLPALGLTQSRLLPGDGHWLIQALHLLLGLSAIGQGEGLAARIASRVRVRGGARSPGPVNAPHARAG